MTATLIQTGPYLAALAKAELFQTYYDGRQYDGLLDWWTERDLQGNYIPQLQRAPSVQYRLGTTICRRMKAFTIGRPFPDFTVDESDGVVDLVAWLRDNALASVFPEAQLDAAVQGSAAIVFGFANASLMCRSYRRSQAWPLFQEDGQLAGLVIRYAGYHPTTGMPCWFRGILDSRVETWETAGGIGGPWTAWRTTEHNLGFVPAVWLRNLVASHNAIDGISVLDGILPSLKALDYSLSRQDRALAYTADPQAVIEDDNPEDVVKRLVKSPAGTWIVGKGGKIYYLEIDGKGIELQGNFADRMRKAALEVARVALTDPDSIKGGELSGYALRMVHEAMIDLADEQRLILEKAMREMLCKIIGATQIATARGELLNLPAASGETGQSGWPWARAMMTKLIGDARNRAAGGAATAEGDSELYHPWIEGNQARRWPRAATVSGAWDIDVEWSAYFDPSPQEDLESMQAIAAARSSGVASLETCVRTAAPLMRAGNVEEEIARVKAENPGDGLV